MAEVTIPNGWKKDGDQGYLSSNHKPIKDGIYFQYSVDPKTGNRIVYGIAPQISTGLTNQVTGQSFDIGGSRKEVMSIDSNGKITKLTYYDEISKQYGNDGIKKLTDDSKQAATTLLKQTGTTDSVKNSTEYKSSLANTENGDSSNIDTGKEGLSKFDQDKFNQAISDGDYRKEYKGGVVNQNYYIYPITMSGEQDRIKFTMFRYQPKKVDISVDNFSKGQAFSGENRNKSSPLGTAFLPIQPDISDSNRVSWGDNEMDAVAGLAAAAAYGTILGGGENLEEAGKGIIKGIAENKGDITSLIAGQLGGEAAGLNKNFLTRVTGAILNPNLELLFNGPELRSFSFTFIMSAREPKESIEIRNIIRFFKQGMSVKRSNTNLFLKTPNVFDISYEGKCTPWINKIKTCALRDCSVTYTPDQSYATYEDGAMTSYRMTLSFTEIDPIYDDNYGIDPITKDIGY